MYHTDSNGNKTTDASYLALLVGDRLLLVKVPPNTIQNATTTMTGALVDLPSEEQSYIIQNLESQYPDIKGAFLPVMLDATNFKTGGTVGLVLGILAIGVCLFFLIRGLMRSVSGEASFYEAIGAIRAAGVHFFKHRHGDGGRAHPDWIAAHFAALAGANFPYCDESYAHGRPGVGV